jgi:hypothetical protein
MEMKGQEAVLERCCWVVEAAVRACMFGGKEEKALTRFEKDRFVRDDAIKFDKSYNNCFFLVESGKYFYGSGLHIEEMVLAWDGLMQ